MNKLSNLLSYCSQSEPVHFLLRNNISYIILHRQIKFFALILKYNLLIVNKSTITPLKRNVIFYSVHYLVSGLRSIKSLNDKEEEIRNIDRLLFKTMLWVMLIMFSTNHFQKSFGINLILVPIILYQIWWWQIDFDNFRQSPMGIGLISVRR